MKFAVTQLMFSPPLPSPMTYDYWMQLRAGSAGCLTVRNIHWLYSLVSSDRSICVYQVPYGEAIREAYREARISPAAFWHGQGTPAIPNVGVEDWVVLVETAATSENDLPDRLKPLGVLSNGARSVLYFPSASLEAVQAHYAQSHYGQAQVPIWQAQLIHPLD